MPRGSAQTSRTHCQTAGFFVGHASLAASVGTEQGTRRGEKGPSHICSLLIGVGGFVRSVHQGCRMSVRVGSCRARVLRSCGSCRFVSKFVCVPRGPCHARRTLVWMSCVSGSVRLNVFVCLCMSCVSRVMRVACHACQNLLRVMRVVRHVCIWIGSGSLRVRVRFLRVCGSCLLLRVLGTQRTTGKPTAPRRRPAAVAVEAGGLQRDRPTSGAPETTPRGLSPRIWGCRGPGRRFFYCDSALARWRPSAFARRRSPANHASL
jgi:hypothetical protein